jgi:aspartyl-tRNA synthetase
MTHSVIDLRPFSKESTGDIEVEVQTFTLLNSADGNLPFIPSDNQNLV